MISLIWAMDENRVIGINNSLPWKLPADMKWFRAQTMGKPIIMGRKTFESFGAKPLPGRDNIVITRDLDYQAEGIKIAHSIEQAITAAGSVDEIMIIGGASFYEQMLPHADRLYVTIIHEEFQGDAWFPDFNMEDWKVMSREDHQSDEKNPHNYSFIVYSRNQSDQHASGEE